MSTFEMYWEPLTTRRVIHADGSPDTNELVNTAWPKRIGVTAELIALADPAIVQFGEGAITFNFDNGSATYRIIGKGDYDVWDCELWSSEDVPR